MYEANLHSFQEELDTLIPLSKNEPVVFYDMEKNIKDIPDLFQKEMEMSPFGVGNEKPVYLIRDFSLSPVQGKFYEVKGKKNATSNIGAALAFPANAPRLRSYSHLYFVKAL